VPPGETLWLVTGTVEEYASCSVTVTVLLLEPVTVMSPRWLVTSRADTGDVTWKLCTDECVPGIEKLGSADAVASAAIEAAAEATEIGEAGAEGVPEPPTDTDALQPVTARAASKTAAAGAA
jgi:hypothetical protein